MIRPATPDDVEQIAAIWNAIIRDTSVTFTTIQKSNDDIAELIAAEPFLVWDEDDRALGFTRYAQFRGGDGYRQTVEHSILLHPDARGRGIGRALLNALMAQAKDAGVHSMIAAISAENPGAVRFHTGLGFSKVAVLPQVGFKFGRWMDLVLMQKLL